MKLFPMVWKSFHSVFLCNYNHLSTSTHKPLTIIEDLKVYKENSIRVLNHYISATDNVLQDISYIKTKQANNTHKRRLEIISTVSLIFSCSGSKQNGFSTLRAFPLGNAPTGIHKHTYSISQRHTVICARPCAAAARSGLKLHNAEEWKECRILQGHPAELD